MEGTQRSRHRHRHDNERRQRRRSQSMLEEHQLSDPIIPGASVAELNYEVIQDESRSPQLELSGTRTRSLPFLFLLPPSSFLLPPPWLTVFLQRIFFPTTDGAARGSGRRVGSHGVSRGVCQCESVRRCLPFLSPITVLASHFSLRSSTRGRSSRASSGPAITSGPVAVMSKASARGVTRLLP